MTAVYRAYSPSRNRRMGDTTTDIDRIRAVLDKCADDTTPGETDHIGTYDAYESAIDAISRIAYPEEVYT